MRTAEGHGTDWCPTETREKISAAQAGPQGHQWRGEDVGYSGIHKRARAVLPAECALADRCRSHHNRYDGKRPPERTLFGAVARS